MRFIKLTITASPFWLGGDSYRELRFELKTDHNDHGTVEIIPQEWLTDEFTPMIDHIFERALQEFKAMITKEELDAKRKGS